MTSSRTGEVAGLIPLVILATACCLVGAAAIPAAARDIANVAYFDTTQWDNSVHISNPAEGSLCAEIYVFDSRQQMQECCGCPVSSDGLLNLSVLDNLSSNPFNTTKKLSVGLIRLISGFSSRETLLCDPTTINQGKDLAPALEAWITHAPSLKSSTSSTITPLQGVTEEEFEDSPLGQNEADNLASGCLTIKKEGSGFGTCSCGPPS